MTVPDAVNRLVNWLNCVRLLTVASLLAAGVAPAATPPDHLSVVTLQTRVIATGLHRAFGIRQVGRFHSGGPLSLIHI